MNVARVATIVSLIVAAASLFTVWLMALNLSSLEKELRELRETLEEVEDTRKRLVERIREMETLLNQSLTHNLTAGASSVWYPVISGDVRALAYILPSRVCDPRWRESYGDRIYFYVYEDLNSYKEFIREDFDLISRVYNTLIVVVPAEDRELFYSNLRLLDSLASEKSLKIFWAIFPKWKYGAEWDYLYPGTRMNKLLLEVMSYLSNLNSTWLIAVWYGWRDRADPREVISFYESLPEKLKPFYALWLDQPYVEVARGLVEHDPKFLTVTELYSEAAISAYSGMLKRQMIVTGYYGARSPEDWLSGISRKLSLVKGFNRYLGVWIYYDLNDGHGEEYATFRLEWGSMPNPFTMKLIKVSGSP